MKKLNLLLVTLMLSASVFMFSCKEDKQKEQPEITNPKPVDVPFTKEGELTFVDNETLKPITKIDIEIADDEAQVTQGLMWRRQMADSVGMLFIFPEMAPRSFWMKNTFIPLDIIYVDDQNKLVSIAKNTTPHSEASVPSAGPAKYVIEVNAGFSEKYGITAGDFIEFNRL